LERGISIMIDQRILLLLITGVSAVFGVTGSTLIGDFEVDAQVPIPVNKPQEKQADVPYVPTPQRVVNTMLELAKVNSNDVVYDLGSGDGRIPITAVQKYKCSSCCRCRN